jgi:hypothetical protein
MTSPRIVAGALLTAIPVVFMAGFTGLQMTFGYPDILRQPAGEVLTSFAAGGVDLHLYWYAMFLSALALVAASIAAGLTFWKRDPLLAGLSIGFGALAGLVQGLALLRWVILANQYLGAGVGEHVGYMFTAVWTALISALIFRDHKIVASAGLVIAAGVAFGLLEPFGVGLAGAVVAISFSLWAVWALIVGVTILRGKSEAVVGLPQAA